MGVCAIKAYLEMKVKNTYIFRSTKVTIVHSAGLNNILSLVRLQNRMTFLYRPEFK